VRTEFRVIYQHLLAGLTPIKDNGIWLWSLDGVYLVHMSSWWPETKLFDKYYIG
jgi:hypothetical protein